MTDEKYNGWTNYETWLLKLNLDNDQGIYTTCHDWFKENYKITEIEKPNLHEIADSFKEFLEEMFFIEEHNIYKIFDTWTNRDWQEINWFEIIESYIQELTEASWRDDHEKSEVD